MDRSRLDYFKGFLVYVLSTYRDMNPYLKLLHLRLYSWRPHREEEGWKLQG